MLVSPTSNLSLSKVTLALPLNGFSSTEACHFARFSLTLIGSPENDTGISVAGLPSSVITRQIFPRYLHKFSAMCGN